MHRQGVHPGNLLSQFRTSFGGAKFFEKKFKLVLDIFEIFAIISHVPSNTALWCSRLARQPVTLEVDGSSPFGVAKKEKLFRKEGLFFFAIQRMDSKI